MSLRPPILGGPSGTDFWPPVAVTDKPAGDCNWASAGNVSLIGRAEGYDEMIGEEPPLYLHIFDRELARSLNFTLTARRAEGAVMALLLGTTSRLYCGLSLVWESDAFTQFGPESRGLREFLTLLLRFDELKTLSDRPTQEEFIESRRDLYGHVRAQYPMYFDARAHSHEFRPTVIKATATTPDLERRIHHWSQPEALDRVLPTELAFLQRHRTNIRATLNSRENRAITGALFDDALDTNASGRLILRRRISSEYTNHYLEYLGGDIPTGLLTLQYYDFLAKDYPLNDLPLLVTLFETANLASLISQDWGAHRKFWDELPAWRRNPYHRALRQEISVILRALRDAYPGHDRVRLRDLIYRALDHASQSLSAPSGKTDEQPFASALTRLTQLRAALRRNPAFAPHLELAEKTMSDNVDVVLVTATDLESDVLLRMLKERGIALRSRHCEINTYQDLGSLGGARVMWGRCDMGSGGPGGATLTISDAITDLKPTAVIMFGVAFGMRPGKQKLGDILVSEMVCPYEFQSVKTGPLSIVDKLLKRAGELKCVPRGPRVEASKMLLQRFRAACVTWKGAEVHSGIMLSGEKVIDNLAFREALAANEPKAIGGEMEIAGLFAAAARRPTHWIAAKGICDWADGTKSTDKRERQLAAATNSMEFIFHVIDSGGLAPQDPH